MKVLHFCDPGHSWYAVPRRHLEALGIARDISGCSYQSRDGSIVYLEEDCDAPRFFNAFRARYDERIVLEGVEEDLSSIRDLPGYKP